MQGHARLNESHAWLRVRELWPVERRPDPVLPELAPEAERPHRDEELLLDEHLRHVRRKVLEAVPEKAERKPLPAKPPLREEPKVVQPALQELPLYEAQLAPLHVPLQHALKPSEP